MRVWGIPSERAVVEEELAIAGCCGEGSGDGDGAGVEEDGGGVGASDAGVVAELPAADSASRSVGLVGFRWGVRGHGEPWRACVPRGPHLSIYGAARRGPTNHGTVGRPRSGREVELDSVVGPSPRSN